MPRGAGLLLLSLIVATGIGLRFYGLGSRGLVLFDEAYYANAAKTPVYALEWMRKPSWEGSSLGAYLRGRGALGLPVKPGHVFPIAIGFLVAGVHDYIVLAVSAVASMVTVFAVYAVGRRFFDAITALTAAALFAVSGNSIAFARTGYPQADTVMVLVMMTYLYLRSTEDAARASRWVLGAGLMAGFGLLMHQSIIVGVGALLLTEVVRVAGTRQIAVGEWKRRMTSFLGGLVLPYAVAEGVYRLAGRSLLSLHGDYLRRGAFRITDEPWQLIQIQLHRSSGWAGVFGENLTFLMRMFGELETPVFWLLAVAGLGLLACRARGGSTVSVLLAGQIALPFLYGIFVYSTLKAVQVALPAIVLAAGAATSVVLSRMKSWIPRPVTVAVSVVLVCVILAVGAVWTRPWITYRAGYREAVTELVQYLRRHGGTFSVRAQDNLAPMLAFYLGEEMKTLAGDVSARIRFDEAGGDYVVVDYQRLSKGDPAAVKRLVEDRAAVIRVANAPRMLPVYHLHRAVPSNVLTSYEAVLACTPCPEMADIVVYDLRTPARR